MLRLILMRHAKSDWNHIGLADHDRPLNKRGKASAKALGDWLREKGYIPQEVFCSSAERTGQTLLGLQLGTSPDTKYTRALYHADAQSMLTVLHGATAPCVLMLGHNPGICEFAHRLVCDPPAHDRFSDYPTGATLVCDFDAPDWAEVGWFKGSVVDFVVPRELLADE
ncbi:MAG: histidine phosphatase family protein [Roseobacter sp.]|nr:histidine phosphatase family protein [Roseobacter sp.]